MTLKDTYIYRYVTVQRKGFFCKAGPYWGAARRLRGGGLAVKIEGRDEKLLQDGDEGGACGAGGTEKNVSSHADTRAPPQVQNVKMMQAVGEEEEALVEEVKEPRSFSPEAARRAMGGGAKPTKSFVTREIHTKVHVSLSPPRLGGAVCLGRTGLNWRTIGAPEAWQAMRAGSHHTHDVRDQRHGLEEVSTVGWHEPTRAKSHPKREREERSQWNRV